MTDTQHNDELIGSREAANESLRDLTPETPCPYLRHQVSRSQAYRIDYLPPEALERLIAMGYRRSGRVIYRPRCRNCSACRSLRVRVEQLNLTRSLKRVDRRNWDVKHTITKPVATDEKHEIFCRYLDYQHDGSMSQERSLFDGFLFDSPTDSIEFDYTIGGRLVAVSIADRVPRGLSSVYTFFDPDFHARSLGSLSAIREAKYCRQQGLEYYYLGFWIDECNTMSYKARFRPNEILAAENLWVPFRQ